jgi:hypothetical protein
MRQLKLSALMTVLALTALLGTPALSVAQDTHNATLNAVKEILTCFSEGNGTFQATIGAGDTAIDYQLSYEGLTGTVTQAHIHFGKRFEQGGIMVFLCSNLPSPPPNTPACPASPGTVTGTLDANGVIGPAGQGINPGEFAKLVAVIR